VWTLLYCLIAISGAIAFSRPGGQAARARKLWALQLVLNFAWTAVFFGLRSPVGGLLVIVALWCSILAYIREVRLVSRAAARLFVPYALWVSFASALNAAIWWLNRDGGA
jgi:tryptophan-rich sensory protein